MEFLCNKCGKVYNIDPSRIPSGKKNAKCKVCGGTVFFNIETHKDQSEKSQLKQKKCEKCGYERNDSDYAPEEQCPKCGVIYAKITKKIDIDEKKGLNNENNLKSNNKKADINKYFPKEKIALLYIVIALSIGFFIGREHLKYEMRQAMTEAANQFKQGMSEIFSPSKKESSAPRESQQINGKNLGVKLIRKSYRDFDVNIGNKAVTFTLEFTNTNGKDIRAFDGLLVFNDLLDNPIKKLNLSYTKPIAIGETVSWNGEMDYNQFIDSDRLLRSKEVNDLKVKLVLRKILYSDGTTEEF